MLALDSLLDAGDYLEVIQRSQQGHSVAVHPTREMLVASYDLLQTMLPFRGWRLPPSEDVKFRVLKRATTNSPKRGEYLFDGSHRIEVTDVHHQTLIGIVQTVAHEMVHLKQQLDGSTDVHGKTFHKLADRVCKVHLWDRGSF